MIDKIKLIRYVIRITIPYMIYKYLKSVKLKKCVKEMAGKVVVITGASSGLGEKLAHRFYDAGCKVVLTARRREDLERVKRNILISTNKHPFYPPLVIPLDLQEPSQLPRKIKEILSICGQIDILINNAGIGIRATVNSTSIDVYNNFMQTNFFGALILTKTILPEMISRRQGQIVFIGTVQTKCSIPYRSAYSASKSALTGFADSLRAEVYEYNVKVNVVTPDFIKSDFSKNSFIGDGSKYGITDSSYDNGTSTQDMAEEIFKAICLDKKELISIGLAPRIAMWCRFLAPDLYFWAMSIRAKLLSERQVCCANI